MAEHEHEHDDEHDDEHEHDELTEEEAQAEAERLVRKEIALAQIRQYGDPALRMRAEEVEEFDEELRAVAERMTGVMHDAEGVGLAATQVGILRRFFVCTIDGEDRVLVNPVVTQLGKDTDVDSEGCLSLGSVRVPVERTTKVAVEARDVSGEPVSLELEGTAKLETTRETTRDDHTMKFHVVVEGNATYKVAVSEESAKAEK